MSLRRLHTAISSIAPTFSSVMGGPGPKMPSVSTDLPPVRTIANYHHRYRQAEGKGHYRGGFARVISYFGGRRILRFDGQGVVVQHNHKIHRATWLSHKHYVRLHGTGIMIKRSRNIFVDQTDIRQALPHPLVSIEVV